MSLLSRDVARSLRGWRRSVGEVKGVLEDVAGGAMVPAERRHAHQRSRADHISTQQAKREAIDGVDRNTRVHRLYGALAHALRKDTPTEALKAWLHLAILWDFAPTYSDLVRS